MRARITKLLAGLAAVAALAIGGTALAGAASTPASTTPPALSSPADTTQQGDQAAPDTGAAASESSSESASEPVTANDGPGGHADEPSTSSVDNQFQGEQ